MREDIKSFEYYYGLNPPLTSSIVLLLKGTKGKTLSGTKVSIWEDQTSNNNDASQGTDANRPVDNSEFLTFDKFSKTVGIMVSSYGNVRASKRP